MIALPIHVRHSQNNTGGLESEANHLLPAPQRQHRVRIQGRLAVVRSVSTVNLRPAPSVLTSPSGTSRSRAAAPTAPRFESGVAGSTVQAGRRRSLDDLGNDNEEEEYDVKETTAMDCQLRGYGIGGAGNIRRPTEAYGSRKANVSSAFPTFSSSNQSTLPNGADKTLWRLRDFLRRTRNSKEKESHPDNTHVTSVPYLASQAQLQLENKDCN